MDWGMRSNDVTANGLADSLVHPFNSLPKAVKECISPDSFKKTPDDYVMSLPDNPPTPSYVAVNNDSILDWTVTSSRVLPEKLFYHKNMSNKVDLLKYFLLSDHRNIV